MELWPVVVAVIGAGLAVLALRSLRRGGAQAKEEPSLSLGLARTRDSLSEHLKRIIIRGWDDRVFDEIEEALIAADVGVAESREITERLRAARPSEHVDLRVALRDELLARFGARDRGLKLDGPPAVIVVVGVNGTGKTTTVAKLARYLQAQGRQPLLGVADTFRPAADSQLKAWGERLDLQVVAGSPRSDPASVAFDALQAATARGRDTVIIDTAGRLHSSRNLMQELEKIVDVLGRGTGRGVDEVLLVLDAMGGQNGLVQAREFAVAVPVTGIVLTKLDGTARGGVVVAAESRYDIPVKFVGVGEQPTDLVAFDPKDFVEALLEGV